MNNAEAFYMTGECRAMDGKDFDLFDFAAANAAIQEEERENVCAAVAVQKTVATPEIAAAPRPKVLNRSELHQAAFAFLVSLHPTAAAANVPTRSLKYQAAAAAFWKTNSRRNKVVIDRTAIVAVYENVDDCFSDCAGREARIAEINRLQKERQEMEKMIRETEPELAAADDLFAEFRTWDYASSKNQEYRKLRRHLEKELHALSQGSRLERIRQAGVADLCYLAVPRGLIDPDLLLPTWGLVELFPESPRFKLIREAIAQDNVSQAGRLNIAVNIGIASGKAARFAAGIDESGKLRRPPRRRGTVL